MGDGCDFARWEEDQKRDQSKQLRVECALAPITKLAFEQMYSDNSGVQYAVRYDSAACNTEDGGAVIEIECIDTVRLPYSRLDWLIACLTKIKQEVGC